MTRHEFHRSVMLEAWKRCGGRCEKCTAKLMPGRYQYDHIVPDALGGEPTLDNCQVLCSACHGEKTAKRDVPAVAKSNRVRAKHLGIVRPKRSLVSRGFAKAPPQHSATRPIIRKADHDHHS